jgi:large subunit ribosomal protein L17
VIRSRDITAKVFSDLAERYRTRPGGYTRVLKLGSRPGDAAPISLLELVDRPESLALPKGKAGEKAEPKKSRAEKKAEAKARAAAASARPAKPSKKDARTRAAKADAAGGKKRSSRTVKKSEG